MVHFAQFFPARFGKYSYADYTYRAAKTWYPCFTKKKSGYIPQKTRRIMNKFKMLFEPCVRRLAEEELSRSALVIGLIIASFCKGRDGLYYGSREYLAQLVGVSVRTVQRALRELIDRGFVEKTVKNGRVCLVATEALMGEKKHETAQKTAKAADQTAQAAEISAQNENEPTPGDGSPTKPDFEAAKAEEAADIAEVGVPTVDSEPINNRENEPRSSAESGGNSSREAYKYAYESGEMPVRYRMLELGKEGYVQMTPKQYEALLTLAPPELVRSYIIRFEKMLEENMYRGGEVKPPHSHYHTIRKWIHKDLSV